MSDSGRPYDQAPDFLTGAFNTLKGFGQGVQNVLGVAAQVPGLGQGLQALGTVGNIATAPFGLPSLLSGDRAVLRAADSAYRTLEGGEPGLFDVPAVARSLQAAREAQAGEFAQIAEDQSQGGIARGIAAAAQFATGGLPNVAPVPFLPGASRTIAGGGIDALRAIRTPKGLIASRFEELASQGLTPEQSMVALQHEFGDAAAMRFAMSGEDVFHEVAPAAAPVGAPLGALPTADRRIGEAPQPFEQAERAPLGETVAGGVTVERPQFAGQPRQEFIPTAVSPKMGSGEPRANVGLNLEKIDAPQATKDYIAEVARKNDGFEAQRRGVVTTAESQAAANKIAVDAEKYAYIQPGTALNAEQITAVRDALVAKGNDVTALQEAVRAQEAAGVVSKESTLRLLSAALEHETLQRVYAGARAESGRALRIQREISDGLKRGDVNTTYGRAVELLGGKDNADLLVQRMQSIWTDPKLSAAEREVATFRFIRNIDRATTPEKIQEFWTNAVLSSPVTHAVNLTGQSLLHIADLGSGFVTAAVEAVSTLGGLRRPRERTFSGAFGALASTGDGFRRAVLNLRDADKTLATKFRETGTLQSGQAIGSGFSASRLERGIGAVVNVPTKLLGAEDAVFRGLGEARGIYEAAYDTAAREGITPLSGKFAERVAELIGNPTDEMIAHAKDVSARAALRMEGGAGSKALIALRDKWDIGGFKPLRYVVPFVTTPMNIVKIGAEYSPAGFLQAIRKTGGARSEAIARAGLGSAGMAYFAQQFALGNITGPAPQEPAAKDAFYASGKIPFAVNLGGTWYSYSRLEPIATPLKWTAAMMQSAQDNPGQTWDVTASKMAFSLARLMEDSTYLSGVAGLVDAMQDPNKATQFIQGIVGGFNPAIVRTLVQSNDPFIRDPKGIWQQIESTLPYLNEQVPVKQTVFGEPAMRTEGKQGLAGVVSPVDFSAEQNDPVTQKVMSYRLPESFGPDGQPLPARGLNVGFVSQDIASFHLNTDEGRRYQTLAGQATKNLLTKLFGDELPYEASGTGEPTAFSKLIYEDQVRAIRKTIADAREVGRAQAADEFMTAATNDGQVARAALMRLSTIGKLRDQARYIAGLELQGHLTPSVTSALNAARGKDDPTVAEFVAAAPVINDFVSEPPYLIGDDGEWAQLRVDRARAQAYADATGKPAGMALWRWYAQVDPDAAVRIRVYDRPQVRSPQRAQMLRDYPWLARFVTGA